MSTQFASMNEHQISIAVHSILGGLASQAVRTTVISELLAPALAYIHGHFADDISLDDLAEMCGISKSHFIRSFKRYVAVRRMGICCSTVCVSPSVCCCPAT